MSTLEVCPMCGGEFPLYMDDTGASGRCPCGYAIEWRHQQDEDDDILRDQEVFRWRYELDAEGDTWLGRDPQRVRQRLAELVGDGQPFTIVSTGEYRYMGVDPSDRWLECPVPTWRRQRFGSIDEAMRSVMADYDRYLRNLERERMVLDYLKATGAGE